MLLWLMRTAVPVVVGIVLLASPGAAQPDCIGIPEIEKRIEACSRYLERLPSDPTTLVAVYRALGADHSALRRYGEALRYFDGALQIDLGNANVLIGRGDVYFAWSEKAAQVPLDSPDPKVNQATYHHTMFLRQQAVTDYRRAADLGSADARERLKQLGAYRD